MAELTFYFKVAFEGISTLICVILAIVVYLRSSTNRPNQFLASAFLLFGFYTLGVLIYDIFAVDASGNIFIAIFIRFSLVSILFGGMFLFFAMMGQGHSAMWYTFKKNTLPWIGIVTAYSLLLIIWNGYIFSGDHADWVNINSYQPVDTSLNVFVLIPLIILLLIFLISSTSVIYTYGVKKTEGLRKHNMQRFLTGILIAIGGTLINVLGQLPIFGTYQNTVSQILDLVFFALIALSVIVMFTGIAVRSKSNVPVQRKDMEEKEK